MKRKYNIGDIYVNNQGESFKIINYIDSKHVEIEFLDSHFKKTVSSGNITKKEIKDPYYPNESDSVLLLVLCPALNSIVAGYELGKFLIYINDRFLSKFNKPLIKLIKYKIK